MFNAYPEDRRQNTRASNCYFGLDFIILIPAEEYKGLSELDLSQYTTVFRKGTKLTGKTVYKYEGEDLVTTAKANAGKAASQAMANFGASWSGSSQLFWTGAGKNATLTLNIWVEKAGDYKLTAALTKARDYGDISFIANNKKCGEFSGYNNGVILKIAEIDTATLKEGYNQILVRITEKNATATNYYVGIDYIMLTETPSKQ